MITVKENPTNLDLFSYIDDLDFSDEEEESYYRSIMKINENSTEEELTIASDILEELAGSESWIWDVPLCKAIFFFNKQYYTDKLSFEDWAEVYCEFGNAKDQEAEDTYKNALKRALAVNNTIFGKLFISNSKNLTRNEMRSMLNEIYKLTSEIYGLHGELSKQGLYS